MKWVVGIVASVAVLGFIGAVATQESRRADVRRMQAETRWLEAQAAYEWSKPRESALERGERLGDEDLDRRFMEFDSFFERAGMPELKHKPRSKRYQEERREERRLELEERRDKREAR